MLLPDFGEEGQRRISRGRALAVGVGAPVVGGGPFLRCVFEAARPPGTTPTCDTAGVLGAAVMIVASCQAVDAIKVLMGRRDLVSTTLLDFDAWNLANRRRLDISKSK